MSFYKLMYGVKSGESVSKKLSKSPQPMRAEINETKETKMDALIREYEKNKTKNKNRMVNAESTINRIIKELVKTKEDVLQLKRTLNRD